MSYLSQKKHQIRENLLLNVAVVILTFLTLFSLINIGIDIVFPNLFHIYILSFALFVYSLLVKKYKNCLIFMMLFIINYTALSSSGNIFLSDSHNGNKKIELSFDQSSDILGSFNKNNLNKGSLILANNVVAHYVKIAEENPITIIKINLSDIDSKLRKRILNQLQHFITKQDTPIVLYGNFGVPSWNRYLRRFAVQTRLVVKNKILFMGNSIFKYFTMPNFYVFGFSDMGVDNIKITNNNGKNEIITFDILF